MSALRVASGQYRDPFTGERMEVGVQVDLPASPPPGEVERRQATAEELARLAPKPRPRVVDPEREARRIAGASLLAARREANAALYRERERDRHRRNYVPHPRPKAEPRPKVRDDRTRETMQRIAEALRVTGGNRRAAAPLVGLSISVVVYHTIKHRDQLPDDVIAILRPRGRPPVPKPRHSMDVMLAALIAEGGHRSRAARRLGIDRGTLGNHLRRIDLPVEVTGRDGRSRAA